MRPSYRQTSRLPHEVCSDSSTPTQADNDTGPRFERIHQGRRVYLPAMTLHWFR